MIAVSRPSVNSCVSAPIISWLAKKMLGYCIGDSPYATLLCKRCKNSKKQKIIMFRKIVSNLSFSPALVGQLAFYAKRLRKEEATRRIGLVFVALALVVQSMAVFNPPESANAASTADFVYGGLGVGANKSLNNFLVPYDNNSTNLRDIMNSAGITRAEIAAAQFGSFWTPGKLSWGREPRAGQSASINVYNANWQQVGAIYGRDMTIANGNTDIYGWIGYSAKVGWFAIMQACGNLVTNGPLPQPQPPKPPEPPKPNPAKLSFSKKANNISQGNINATKQAAKSGDRITYTISATNSGGSNGEVVFEDVLTDTLQYSTLTDTGGGTFDKATGKLTWPKVTVKPRETVSRTYSVSILASIPATPTGTSDPASYDCVMENVFKDNSVSVPLDCAPPKVIETIVTELPKTGPAENMMFAGVVLAVVLYFYLRSRQLGKEVRLIRRDLNAGVI